VKWLIFREKAIVVSRQLNKSILDNFPFNLSRKHIVIMVGAIILIIACSILIFRTLILLEAIIKVLLILGVTVIAYIWYKNTEVVWIQIIIILLALIFAITIISTDIFM
jgi:hypothetical protein